MAEFSGKKTHNQRIFKGCSCKKSQCIKNYCDCYQSMIICTKYCKCIGCRNTEQRESVAPKSEATKKINDTEVPVGLLHTKTHTARQSAASTRNIHSLTTRTQLQHHQQQPQQLKTKQQIASQHPTQQPKQVVPPTPAPEDRNLNILMPEVCDAVLASLLAQEEEAEQVGLDVQERAQLLINEMERCLSVIYKASLPM